MNEQNDKSMINPMPVKPMALPPAGINRNDAPGGGGRGAMYVCSKCGNRYADTGVGCPVCNRKNAEEKK